jgi:hypothetical protein
VGKNSKSQSDLPRGENFATVFKSGDLERAVKAHCAYLFKSKVVEGAEQPSLKAGETWARYLLSLKLLSYQQSLKKRYWISLS